MSGEERLVAEIPIVANPDPAEVAAMPELVWIHSLWVGVERLVSELGASAPSIVRLVDPELSRVMAEAVLAWTSYLQRDMPLYRRQQSAKLWQQQPYGPPSAVKVGLLGLGALGTASADRLSQAGFVVSGWSRSPKSIDGIESLYGDEGLRQLLSQSDIVICLLPLTADTIGLLNAERFGWMKDGAALINFARGRIVAVPALLAHLDAGRLSHAVLDVFDKELLSEASPLWDHPDITVLPHISAPTDLQSASRIVADNIRFYRKTNVIPRTIDIAKGY
ncbi:glyoxylate/hydroxypyruvate reductase A [Agrobacterium rhizogenes]|nr:glyoxylate/hydroxypyruvate reductase A [Rhizobium rhizogenes]